MLTGDRVRAYAGDMAAAAPPCEHRRRPVPRQPRPRSPATRAGRSTRSTPIPAGRARCGSSSSRSEWDEDGLAAGGRPLARHRLRRGVRRARLRPPPRPLVPGAPPEPGRARGAVAGDAPPGPADAARLVLGFGRLVERVAAAGFAPELAGVDDFAVGPGPTPVPRAAAPAAAGGRPRGAAPAAASGCSRACSTPRRRAATSPTACASGPSAPRAGGFGSLGECLDELERAGTSRGRGDAAPSPPGLSGIFDDDELDAMERAAARGARAPAPDRRAASPVAVVAGDRRAGAGRPGTRTPRRAHDGARHGPADDALHPRGSGHRTAGERCPAQPRQHRRRRGSIAASAAPAPNAGRHDGAAPAARRRRPHRSTPAAPAEPTGGATVLPAPGGTTLPCP